MDFLFIGNFKFFNCIYNYSIWGNVVVGMIGLVMNDEELVFRVLYGLNIESNSKNEWDNDGGLIWLDGMKKVGFFV